MGDEVPDWGGLVAPALHKILAKASAAGSFSHCLVNRHWYSLSHGALSCLKPRTTLGADELRRVLEQCPNPTSITSPEHVDYKPCLLVLAKAYSSKTSLTRLEVLNISSPIPDCLSSLGSLSHLTLRQWARSGSEDPNLQAIFHLTNLRGLCLHVQSVAHLPEELGNLVGLTELEIREHYSVGPFLLESLPDSLTNLHSLQKLVLTTPGLRTLPPDFHRLRNLTQLEAWRCSEMVGILSGMEEAPRLRELQLGVVKNLPCELLCLKSSLTVLRLDHLTGLIPSDLGQLSLLQELSLAYCYDVMTFPEALCGLAALRSLTLDSCHELREIPVGCSRLTSLEILKMQSCHLKKLPEALYGLAALRKLNLESCHELAELPAGFSRLARLEFVTILSCRALKELPEDLVDAPSLIRLFLASLHGLRSLPQSLQDKVKRNKVIVYDCGDVVLP